MKTDVIKIYDNLKGNDEAMDAAERFAVYNGLTGKNAMHIRLLTEETICMVHGILYNFKGSFWIESEHTKDGLLCRICLSAKKRADYIQEEKIMSVSTSGKNENARGFMGKIREFVRLNIQMNTGDDGGYYPNTLNGWWDMGAGQGRISPHDNAYWSLKQYRENLSEKQNTVREWDELEKSIVAKLATEVKVWLKSDSTVVVIEKLLK